jgi:hypothetical protein
MRVAMSPRRTALLPILMAALALGACSKDKELFPSLTMRDGERVTGSFTPAAPEKLASPPPSTETLGRLAQLRANAADANQRFMAAAQDAQAPVAAAHGSQPGTEAWELAQVALAELSARRSETALFLADLDQIYVETRLDAGDPAQIEAAVNEVAAELSAQDRAIDALEASLGQ